VAGFVDELRDESADFARLWERHDVQAPPTLTKAFQGPVIGPVAVVCDTLNSRIVTSTLSSSARRRDPSPPKPWFF